MMHSAFICYIALLSYEASLAFVAPSSSSEITHSSPAPHVARTSRRDGVHRRPLPRKRPHPREWRLGGDRPHGREARAMARDEQVDATARTSDAMSHSGQSEYVWEVYVSQLPAQGERDGIVPTSTLISQLRPGERDGMVSTSTVIEAFVSLTPFSSNAVNVSEAVFHKKSKAKGRGPTVRCFRRKKKLGTTETDENVAGGIVSALEIGNVDSVDKVCRILTEHMDLGEVDAQAFDCMQFYFRGNRHLDEGEPARAIARYNKALALVTQQPRCPKGSILAQRARAHLAKSAEDRDALRALVRELADDIPSAAEMRILFHAAAALPSMASPLLNRFAGDYHVQQKKIRQIRFRHDMYEYSLLHSAQDGLEVTRLLPGDAAAWLLAGDCLARLRKLEESDQYYRRAREVDPTLEPSLLDGALERNRVAQEFMDVARASGFSGDTLRLALDVAS